MRLLRSLTSLGRRSAPVLTFCAAVVLAAGAGPAPAHGLAAAAPDVAAAACEPPSVDLGGLQVSDLPLVDFFDVPQLGCEPVSGTGCGGDGSIGPVIPDGLWRGAVMSFDAATVHESSSLEFDLWCPYRGSAAEQMAEEWIAEHGEDDGVPWLDGEFMINNNPRTRTVPIGDYLFTAAAVWMPDGLDDDGWLTHRCVSGLGAPDLDVSDIVGWETWLYIEGGFAQSVVRACPYS